MEIIISPIDLNGATIRKLPIARTLEFEFMKDEQGTTDGLEHHILLSKCAPQYLANTRFCGLGDFEKDEIELGLFK